MQRGGAHPHYHTLAPEEIDEAKEDLNLRVLQLCCLRVVVAIQARVALTRRPSDDRANLALRRQSWIDILQLIAMQRFRSRQED